MTSKKRRYGDLSASPPPTDESHLIDDVFAAFGVRPEAQAQQATAPQTIAPQTTVREAIAPPPTVAQTAPEPPPETTAAHDATVDWQAMVNPRKWMVTPHDISDKIEGLIGVYQASVLRRLYRLAWGFEDSDGTCRVGHERLSKACGMSKKQAQRAVAGLIERGLVTLLGHDLSHSLKRERGNVYRVNLPKADTGKGTVAPQSTVARQAMAGQTPNKIKDHKKEISKEDRCALCESTGGFLYPNGIGGGGVVKCTHAKGK